MMNQKTTVKLKTQAELNNEAAPKHHLEEQEAGYPVDQRDHPEFLFVLPFGPDFVAAVGLGSGMGLGAIKCLGTASSSMMSRVKNSL